MNVPLLPGATLGVLGGGQLGRMMALAARRMGYRTVMWVGGPNSGPADAADHIIEDPFDSDQALERFVSLAEVATVEFENIPATLLEAVAERIPLRPGVRAIVTSQHREREKVFLNEHGFPCAPFTVVDDAASLRTALDTLPDNGGILKTAEFGYDGKGQVPVSRGDDAERLWASFGAARGVLEHKIALTSELSVLVVRSASGETISYDPAENHHRDHILDISVIPARISKARQEQARGIAEQVAAALDYVGIMAVEFFLSADGALLVNEIAPRPHNSGHHTIDACATSQFEQQVRCLCGLPPGSTRLHSPTVMLNLLGDVWLAAENNEPDWVSVLTLPGTHLHLYGKHEPKSGRKMGHITITAETAGETLAIQKECRRILGLPGL